MYNSSRRGFSLIELSIVLVILGLLTGGILAGRSLIRASELRSVTSEYQRYVTAAQAFRDKYFALPGDMTNATSFWGDDNATCPDPAIANGTPGTCNGNGNGQILLGTEMHRFWQQLMLAGLIEGTYTGLAGSGGGIHVVPGSNAPTSKLGNAGWGVFYIGYFPGDTTAYRGDYSNNFIFGAPMAGTAPFTAVIKPEEAWNIDTKMDDGKPGTGKVLGRYWNSACATSNTNSDYTGEYNLTNDTIQCALHFLRSF